MSDPDLIYHDDGRVSMGKARFLVCMEAMWEAEAIAQTLVDLANKAPIDEGDGQFVYTARGLGARLLDLSKVCALALSDSVPDLGQIAEKFHLIGTKENEQ